MRLLRFGPAILAVFSCAGQTPALVEQGQSRFVQDCAFCHGRDAGGGETGPDLTRSKLVADDVNGDRSARWFAMGVRIRACRALLFRIRNWPSLVAFIHDQKKKAETRKGGRRGVDVADLQTGNVQAGIKYFNGAGGCSSCHSPTGDLAGVAKRFQGLKLEQRLMYPHGAKAKVSVTLSSGEKIAGELAYQDEFTIAVRDSSGRYRSWPVSAVKFTIDDPAEAHALLLAKYTDDDIHNLMAYLQTLR